MAAESSKEGQIKQRRSLGSEGWGRSWDAVGHRSSLVTTATVASTVASVTWVGEGGGRVDIALTRSSPPVFFSSGIFGERLPLRYYLSAGMVLSGLFTSLFGLGYFWDIHMLWYFVLIQV